VVGAAYDGRPCTLPSRYESADEARAMLSVIYNRFTEGFDTANLKEAKAPLYELNGLA
jgi:hypothetical protein